MLNGSMFFVRIKPAELRTNEILTDSKNKIEVYFIKDFFQYGEKSGSAGRD